MNKRGKTAGTVIAAAVMVGVLSGCGSSSAGRPPGVAIPKKPIDLSAQIGPGGRIEPPVSTRTVTLQGSGAYLGVNLDVFAGFNWSQTSSGDSTLLQDQGPEEYANPQPCIPATAVCQATWSEQYQAAKTGTTTLVWTLYASPTSPSATQTGPPALSPNAPACPADAIGATSPPPQSDTGCVAGRVTVTVIVDP